MKRRFFTIILCLLIAGGIFYNLDKITDLVAKYFNSTPAVVLENKNPYAKEVDYGFIQVTDDFVPYNYQDLINIFYTILDAGYDTFTFYCPPEYVDCINDVEKISAPENIEILTTVGNYVSPYNNFTSLKVQYDTAGEITVDINHLYTEEEIFNLNSKFDTIWNTIVIPDMSKEDIIYTFHDYIINNTRYDELYEAEVEATKPDIKTTYSSNKAIGPLFQGYAICSGYTDAMALVLDRLELNNFKVASDTHVWNAVYLNDKWVHLDLTWDDPVSEDHTINNLLHKFFLIDTATLEEFDIKDHTFNKSFYLEFRE